GGALLSFLAVAAMLFKEVRYLLPLVAFAAPLAAWAAGLLPRPLRAPAWAVLMLSGALGLAGWLLPLPGARPVTHPDWAASRRVDYPPPPPLGWLPETPSRRDALRERIRGVGGGVVRWPARAGLNPHWLNLEAARMGVP